MFIAVTDDNGRNCSVNVDHIASLNDRPSGTGTVVRLGNGTALNVVENRHDLLNRIDYPPPVTRDSASV